MKALIVTNKSKFYSVNVPLRDGSVKVLSPGCSLYNVEVNEALLGAFPNRIDQVDIVYDLSERRSQFGIG